MVGGSVNNLSTKSDHAHYAYLGKSQFTVDPYFDGQLDEVRVYRRALSAAEVQTLAQFTGP
jgi:hypothetical protein